MGVAGVCGLFLWEMNGSRVEGICYLGVHVRDESGNSGGGTGVACRVFSDAGRVFSLWTGF